MNCINHRLQFMKRSSGHCNGHHHCHPQLHLLHHNIQHLIHLNHLHPHPRSNWSPLNNVDVNDVNNLQKNGKKNTHTIHLMNKKRIRTIPKKLSCSAFGVETHTSNTKHLNTLSTHTQWLSFRTHAVLNESNNNSNNSDKNASQFEIVSVLYKRRNKLHLSVVLYVGVRGSIGVCG
jgi:hypothetical protein